MLRCFRKILFIFIFLLFSIGVYKASPIPFEIKKHIFTDLQRKEMLQNIYSKLKSGERDIAKQKDKEMEQKILNSRGVQVDYINRFSDENIRAKIFLEFLEYKSGQSNDYLKSLLLSTDTSQIRVQIKNKQPLLIVNDTTWGIV